LFQIQDGFSHIKQFRTNLEQSVNSNHYYDNYAPSIRLWHQDNLAMHVGKGIHIGFPIFELDSFIEEEKMEMSSMDSLIVCSEWAKKILIENTIKDEQDIFVIPLGVDRNIFDSDYLRREKEDIDNEWTTFINIGKWEYRKGHDIIYKAFEQAFSPKDRVRLWMMNGNPFISKEQVSHWESLYRTSKMGHRIAFLPRVNTHDEIARIMAVADCGVFPSRAEGWNLELLEMMSMGKQVITTNYSAHEEFCNYKNSLLIPIDEKEIAEDGVFFKRKIGRWAKLESRHVDILAEYMRDIHKRKQSGEDLTNKEGIDTAKELTWDNMSVKIKEYFYDMGVV
jgi:glycosyltransferase involved in cell wall biosynthesis